LSSTESSVKKLYLVRHSKSSWKNPGLSDFERPLNKRGKRDAPFMGKLLAKRGVRPEIIFSSPAKRALKSAKIIAEEIGYPLEEIVTQAKIYDASVADLLEVVHDFDSIYREVMLFGHNPGITGLVNYLSDFDLDNIPTSGVVCIEFNDTAWHRISRHSGAVVFFEYPKKYLD
jgi:phosphohistidine phosphatase